MYILKLCYRKLLLRINTWWIGVYRCTVYRWRGNVRKWELVILLPWKVMVSNEEINLMNSGDRKWPDERRLTRYNSQILVRESEWYSEMWWEFPVDFAILFLLIKRWSGNLSDICSEVVYFGLIDGNSFHLGKSLKVM